MFQCVRVCWWVMLEMMVCVGSGNGKSFSSVSCAFKHFLLGLSSCLPLPQMDQTRKTRLSLCFFFSLVSCSAQLLRQQDTVQNSYRAGMTSVIQGNIRVHISFFIYYIFNHVSETLVLDVCLCTVNPHLLSCGPAQMCTSLLINSCICLWP